LSGTSQEAHEIFYKTYQKIIKDYLKYKFSRHNTDDIDDYVSEILVKVFYSLDKYNSEKSSFKTWVLAITKNYIIDVHRKNTTLISFTNSGVTTNTAFGEIVNSSNTCNTTSSYNTATGQYALNYNSTSCCNNSDFENCNSISYISSQLSPSDYTLLNMKYIQGYNYCEIGQEFQLTSSTVSNKINYIKAKLKKSMLEEFYD